MELAPARTVELMLAPSLLVSTTGLFPFSPVAAGAEEETVALIAGVGHPGAQHPAVVRVTYLLGREPALSLSVDVSLGAYSLLDDGPLLATSSSLSLLLVSSLRASQILFSKPFLRRHSSIVPLAASLSIPSRVSRSAVCPFFILHQNSFILSLSRSIIPGHLASLSLEAGDLPLPLGSGTCFSCLRLLLTS